MLITSSELQVFAKRHSVLRKAPTASITLDDDRHSTISDILCTAMMQLCINATRLVEALPVWLFDRPTLKDSLLLRNLVCQCLHASPWMVLYAGNSAVSGADPRF
jgi:hypothetical protein